MDVVKDSENFEDVVCWLNGPPPITPGMYYIDPQIKRDFRVFDGSLEDVLPKQLYTDLVDALGINFMEIVAGYDYLEVSRVEENSFLMDVEKRSEVLRREQIKKDVGELFDYWKYMLCSFEDFDGNIVHPIDKSIEVEESFELFPETSLENVIVQSDCTELYKGYTFEVKKEGPFELFSEVGILDTEYKLSCLPQRIKDMMVFCIRDGYAYYSDVQVLYRLQRRKSKKFVKDLL